MWRESNRNSAPGRKNDLGEKESLYLPVRDRIQRGSTVLQPAKGKERWRSPLKKKKISCNEKESRLDLPRSVDPINREKVKCAKAKSSKGASQRIERGR